MWPLSSLLLSMVFPLLATGFLQRSSSNLGLRNCETSKTCYNVKLQRNPNESKDDYFLRLTDAASDQEQFERLTLKKPNRDDAKTESIIAAEEENGDTKPKRGYVRPEEWEAQQQKISKEMSAQERIQFEAQRHGDQFRQNEILRHNLNAF